MSLIEISSPKECGQLVALLTKKYDDDIMNAPDDDPVLVAIRQYFKSLREPMPPRSRDFKVLYAQVKTLWEENYPDKEIAAITGLATSSVCKYRQKLGKCNKPMWEIKKGEQCVILKSLKEFRKFVGASAATSSPDLIKMAKRRGYKVKQIITHEY